MNTAAPITNVVAATNPQTQVPPPASDPWRPRPGLSAPKVLLMGAPGTGKTWSIISMLLSDLEVFVIITEPNGLTNLLAACRKYSAPLDKLHYKYVPPMNASMSSLMDVAVTINTMSYSAIADMKSGIAKNTSGGVMALLKTMENFVDDKDGKAYGECFKWGYNRALVLDSLSGLNMLAQQNTVGLKPTMHQGEWGVAMNFEEMLINKFTSDMKAYFVLIAHIDRNMNEASLQTLITPAALGAKLGPRIGRFFSEVILSKRTNDVFEWSTMELSADVKQSVLPINAKITPSFKPVVDAFNLTLKQLGD